MTTLSIRLPDDMAERLKNIAKVRDISLNKLMFELSLKPWRKKKPSSVL
jgi:predicted transcriptional regulator